MSSRSMCLVALLLPLTAGVALAQDTLSPPTRFSTVALFRLRLPSTFEAEQARIQATYDTLLVAALQRTGCRVIGSAQTDSVFQSVVDSAGGYFDRNTGALDTARFSAVLRGTVAQLGRQFGAQRALFPRVDVAPDSLLTSDERNRTAVRLALDSLIARAPTPP